jgi:hypothetical protein
VVRLGGAGLRPADKQAAKVDMACMCECAAAGQRPEAPRPTRAIGRAGELQAVCTHARNEHPCRDWQPSETDEPTNRLLRACSGFLFFCPPAAVLFASSAVLPPLVSVQSSREPWSMSSAPSSSRPDPTEPLQPPNHASTRIRNTNSPRPPPRRVTAAHHGEEVLLQSGPYRESRAGCIRYKTTGSLTVEQKVPVRSDKQTEPSPSHKPSHARQESKDSVTSVNMSYISRQRIDPRTEQELRAACAHILQNFKPSDHDMPDADPKLDFRGPNRRRDHKTDATHVIKVHRPTGAPPEHASTHGARNETHKVAAAPKGYSDLPLRANTGKRRVEKTDNSASEARPLKSPAPEAPRHVLARAETDTDDGMSVGTPLTASTDTHMYSGSTAPTSVAVTHVSSKRTSRQGDNPAAIADAQAAEWMRQELEKRRQQLAAQPYTRPQTSEKPPSRATSIRSGIRDYMFPGSRSLSRAQSQASLRSQSSDQPKRSGSVQGWRSWGLNRSSSRGSSRPGSSSGRKGPVEHEKKSELNLNRELPPLPSLDTWKEPERPKEQPKASVQGAHIATLMRTQDEQQQSYAAAARQHHRRGGSETIATRHVNAPGHISPLAKSPTQQAFAQKSTVVVPEDRSLDFDHMISAMSGSRTLDDQLKLHVNGHTLHGRTVSRPSADGRISAPNFSRKISTDGPPTNRPFDANEFAYPNVVQITATKAPEQKSKLRKVFSAWALKKEKKSDESWMHRIEKRGIKTGVMMQDEAALPPVVRY